ncbi:SRPBCC family protein [Sphingomonas sp. OTU376]|uniref:SRPBCC family protein n=1 Tax=Sphingomonas sp. OTU376 TaxID=3043863 RepID=UPI00313AA75A
MTSASASIEINAPADRVWAVVGGFDGLPEWLDLIRTSRLEDGGRVRRLEAINGAVIVERLLNFDEEARYFRYRHLEAPDPVTGYVGEMAVEPVSATRSKVRWSGSFTPVGIGEAEAIAHFEGIYVTGLEGLKRRIEK